MAKKKNPYFWLWIFVGILLVCIVYQFVEINKLDSKKLKNEIAKVETKTVGEQGKLREQLKSLEVSLKTIENNLNSVVITQTQSDSTLSKQIATYQNQLTALQVKIDNIPKSGNINYSLRWREKLAILFFLILVILPYILVFCFFRRLPQLEKQEGDAEEKKDDGLNIITRKLKDFIVLVIINSSRIENNFQLKLTPKQTATLLQANTPAVSNVDKQENTKKETVESPHMPTVSEEVTAPQKTATKYLGGKQGKTFSVYNSSEGNFFKLQNETTETTEFVFSGNEKEAIAKRVFSDDICEITSGNYQNAQSVKTDKYGTLKRDGDRWEVKEKIKIKFE